MNHRQTRGWRAGRNSLPLLIPCRRRRLYTYLRKSITEFADEFDPFKDRDRRRYAHFLDHKRATRTPRVINIHKKIKIKSYRVHKHPSPPQKKKNHRHD